MTTANAEPRRPYDIDSLTDVALRVFAERGFDGASMEDVAKAAGITKASIYYHVAGKEALLERGLRRAVDALFAILDQPGASEGRAVDRVRYIAQRVAVTTLELLPELSVLFRIRGNSALEERAIERRRAFDRIVAGLIGQAQADGDVRGDVDPALATRLLFGMSNSVVEWYRPDGSLGPKGIADAIGTLAFFGLAYERDTGGEER
jgi:AcrR family transcriptional regulator